MNAPADFGANVRHALTIGQFGLGFVDEHLIVASRDGALSDWLPKAGEPCCDAPILHGMEEMFAAARVSPEGAFTLPSIRENGAGRRVCISVSWRPDARCFVIVTTPDEGTEQLDRLLVRERREKQLLQQQAAAAADRSRVAATLYRDIVEAANDPVLRLGPDLTLTFANSRAREVFDGAAELDGRPVRQVLPYPERENPWRADMCANGPASFDQPAHDRDGRAMWLWWDVRWLGDNGGPAEFQAVARDITETRRLRAELERASEEAASAALTRERLRIAHDLHDTLVHSIVNLLARLSLMRRETTDPVAREALLAAEAEARQGVRTAREAVAEVRCDPEFPEGPAPALAECVKRLRARTDAPIALEIDAGLAHATAAQSSVIARVAREALRNVELHAAARNIRVSARVVDDRYLLRVEDDGVGFLADGAHDGHYGLPGMGEQAALVGGSLEIASAPGQGTIVALGIPRRAETPDAAQQGSER
jgi:PAS domain S-box-containing protein